MQFLLEITKITAVIITAVIFNAPCNCRIRNKYVVFIRQKNNSRDNNCCGIKQKEAYNSKGLVYGKPTPYQSKLFLIRGYESWN